MRYLNLILLAALIGGCVKAPILARQDKYLPEQIHLASEDLRTHTAVDQPIVQRDAAGLLHVTVPVRAATNLQLYVDYRFNYLDSTGRVIQQTAWMTKTLAPNIPDRISGNSLTPDAANFQLDLRYAK